MAGQRATLSDAFLHAHDLISRNVGIAPVFILDA